MTNIATIESARNTEHTIEDTAPSAGPSVAKPRRAADYTIAQCRGVASRAFSIALAAAGMSQRAAADAAGVSRNLATWWSDVDHPRTVPLGRLLTMAESSRRGRDVAMATLTAALSHVQHASHITDRPRGLSDLMDDLHAEIGELAVEYRAANVDGVIDDDERKRLKAGLVDIERVIASLRRDLERND